MFLPSLVTWLRCNLPAWRSYQKQLNAGQSLVEYALILILVSICLVILAAVLGPGVGNIYSNIVNTMQGIQK